MDWQRKFVVMGGTIAQENVLQIYSSQGEYEEVVYQLFQQGSIHNEVFCMSRYLDAYVLLAF